MRENNVWILVDLSRRCNTIGVKWVLKTKLKADNTVEGYKTFLDENAYKQ